VRKPTLLIGALLFPLSAFGAWFGAEFSADMVSYSPQWRQWQAAGKLYVGDNKMRMDAGQGAQQIINLFDLADGKTYSLNPAQLAYVELPIPENTGIPLLATQPMPGEAGSPCRQRKITCKLLGQEDVSGVTTEKWEIIDERDDLATLRSIEWIDPKRKMVVRLRASGNALTERKYGGETKLGERKVEKWEVVVRQGEHTENSIVYVDPRLRAVVRQETDGEVMALTNIRESPQPASLFQIPAGYRKMTPEEAQRAAGQGFVPR
jgi:hypothetical protein